MEKISKKDNLRNEMKRELRRLRRIGVKVKTEEEQLAIQEEIADTLELIKEAKR